MKCCLFLCQRSGFLIKFHYTGFGGFNGGAKSEFLVYLGKEGAKGRPAQLTLCGGVLCCRSCHGCTAGVKLVYLLLKCYPRRERLRVYLRVGAYAGVGGYGVVIGRLLCGVVLYGGVVLGIKGDGFRFKAFYFRVLCRYKPV